MGTLHTTDDTGVVIDLFTHKAYHRRMMAKIERIRFAAVIDNRLFIRVVTSTDIPRDWLNKLTFRVVTEQGTSIAVGIAGRVVPKDDGINVASATLSPPMDRRAVTEHCTIVAEAPDGTCRTFDYRPTFIQQAL